MCGNDATFEDISENARMLGSVVVCHPGHGMKRKLDEMECSLSPWDERQSVLNISMCKLQMKRRQPSLHRSVLIYNTLKQIQQQLRQEGVAFLHSSAMDTSNSWQASSVPDHGLLDPPVDSPADTNVPSSPLANTLIANDSLNDSLNETTELQRLSTSVSDMLLTSDVLSSSNITSMFDLDSCTPVSLNSQTNVLENATLLTSPGANTDSATSSCPASATVTSVFSSPSTPCTLSLTQLPSFSQSFGNSITTVSNNELDLSVYDFDTICPLTPPSAKHVPLSAEELLHCTTVEPLGSFPGQSLLFNKTESLVDELDHVMQVIWGM